MRLSSTKKIVRLRSSRYKSSKQKKRKLREFSKHKNNKVMLKKVLDKSEKNAWESQTKSKSFNLQFLSFKTKLVNVMEALRAYKVMSLHGTLNGIAFTKIWEPNGKAFSKVNKIALTTKRLNFMMRYSQDWFNTDNAFKAKVLKYKTCKRN